MSLLRRVVVACKNQHIHDIARSVAHEVFMADDVQEAVDIAATVAPELTIFDGTFKPHHVRAYLETNMEAAGRPRAAVVVLPGDSPFSADEYEQAGAVCCLPEDGGVQLRDIAVRIHDGARQACAEMDDRSFFLDETAAAVAMVGRSRAAARTLGMIKLVATSRCNPVLVLGDTGTGKEIAARAVHFLRHPNEPFVAVNCAALTASLLESELFGHAKGSFTGASHDKTGLLELAGSGTIFLDEISEMPLELQAKLLRVLQEKTFRRVGGLGDTVCRATIIASSNRDVKAEVREKRFRQDLYYRLNVCPITLAPLRSPDRREDIPLLAHYFLRTSSICAEGGRSVTSITKLALEALSQHDWPGNVRELRNVIERAILLETTDKIGLGSVVIDPIESDERPRQRAGEPLRDFSLQKAERELIARALHQTGWQKTQAAALLGITRATLYAKVKQYDLRRDGSAAGEMPPVTAEFVEAQALPA